MASSSSSCSSSIFSTSRWMYDVFLSFSGEDTRYTATDFIYFALEQKGIYTFKDDKKLEKGKTIEPELIKAIKESRFAVVILSKNYASSTWCLNELVEIVACEKWGMTILPIFYNVDPSDVRKQQGTFAQPFDEYEKRFEEKVGAWRDAFKHVANIAGFHVDNSPLSEVVKSIVSLISRNSSCTYSEVTEGLVGIDSRVVELGSCLALGLDDDVRFIGIWAMGGMGKTTLARVAYKMVSKEFEASCIIYNVREKCETTGGLLSLQKYLISQFSKESNLNIEDIYDGAHMIKKMLSHRRILLVLDDVNKLVELENLAAKRDWFGRGSRIIVTTRDKHLLKAHLIDKVYEVKALKHKDALHLFCLKAFKKEPIPNEYLELSRTFLKYVDGLPIALQILGSFLFGKGTAEWKNALEMLKEHSEPTVIQVLKISYDGLQEPVQEIFKDIACFFNHEKENHVVQMLNVLGRYPIIGFRDLIDKSLLKISENNELWMHDLVEDMGRNIVRQESLEPGEQSRLWRYEDIDHVLKNNTGTKKVQAININGAKDTSIYHEEKEAYRWPQGLAPLVILLEWVLSALSWEWVRRTLSWQCFTSSKKQKRPLWNPNAFLKMPNLKFLRIRNISLQLDTLPNNLRYFECHDYPLKSLPPLPNELVELHLPHSSIELLWRGMKNFDKLKIIDMVDSSGLIRTPDFDGAPNLEKLDFALCSNLCKLHPSIGKLKKLKFLKLEKCKNLTSLPDKFEMESLLVLDLTRCSKVKKIPEFVGNMKLLQGLFLEGTAITTLPSSIECLTGLNALILRDCIQLMCLPNTICSLTSIYDLDLFGCSKFDKLPEDLGNIVSLKKLSLSRTAIKELPSSFGFLICLTLLDLTNCKDFVLLPSTVCSLTSFKNLDLSGCSKFVNLPEDLGNLKGLFGLSLVGTSIEVLPSSVGSLTALRSLDLSDCKNLLGLPSSICSLKMLKYLDLSRCTKFVNLPENLGNLERLYDLSLRGTAIEVLPSSVGRLTALTSLDIRHCKNLVGLPDNIGGLFSLRGLILDGCKRLRSLPESISQLSRITGLNLDGCKRLRSLPESISQLYRITGLNLAGCKRLRSLPESISQFSRITGLNLAGCKWLRSLPESISQLYGIKSLNLDGCKRLRSLPDIPPQVDYINVNNCTSLERFPEFRKISPFWCRHFSFCVECVNCFNIQIGNNIPKGLISGKLMGKLPYIFPGKEILNGFEKANIRVSSVSASLHFHVCDYSVNIQLPRSGVDELGAILLCVVFVPCKNNNDYSIEINSTRADRKFRSFKLIHSNFGKLESHHLRLHYLETPRCSIDEKGFHVVKFTIASLGVEVETVGFRLLH